MPSDACLEAASPAFLEGVEEFNRGEFYECHETLEALWLAEPRPIRGLYQGYSADRRGLLSPAIGPLSARSYAAGTR